MGNIKSQSHCEPSTDDKSKQSIQNLLIYWYTYYIAQIAFAPVSEFSIFNICIANFCSEFIRLI